MGGWREHFEAPNWSLQVGGGAEGTGSAAGGTERQRNDGEIFGTLIRGQIVRCCVSEVYCMCSSVHDRNSHDSPCFCSFIMTFSGESAVDCNCNTTSGHRVTAEQPHSHGRCLVRDFVCYCCQLLVSRATLSRAAGTCMSFL